MAMEPVEALERVAFLLERTLAPPYRAGAFRTAAQVLGALPEGRWPSEPRPGRSNR